MPPLAQILTLQITSMVLTSVQSSGVIDSLPDGPKYTHVLCKAATYQALYYLL